MTGKTTYTAFHRRSSTLLCLVLFWLTVALPFVQQSMDHKAEKHQLAGQSDEEESDAAPVSQPTEEKTSSNSGLSEEYIHHTPGLMPFTIFVLQHSRPANTPLSDFYIGECIVPPPDHC